MRYSKPCYYHKFQCLADNCPDTCCSGWQIIIDEASLERYGALKGDFGIRLKNGIDWLEDSFLQRQKQCVMLKDNGLCEIQLELGEEALCQTCRNYPRHVEEYEGLRELSLSLSCPAAARIILEYPDPIRFLEEETAKEEEEEFENFNLLLFTKLEDAREVILAIVYNRQRTMEDRLEIALQLSEQMQNCLEEDRICDMDRVIAHYQLYSKNPIYQSADNAEEWRVEDREENRKRSWENPIHFRYQAMIESYPIFHKLEKLREDWQSILAETWNVLYAEGEEHYQAVMDAFSREYKSRDKKREWNQIAENLTVFFVYTYFCGAVYDDWIYSKMALAAFSVCWIQDFIVAKWLIKGKKIDMEDCIQLAYQYAREIEHSDENLNLVEEWLMRKRQDL